MTDFFRNRKLILVLVAIFLFYSQQFTAEVFVFSTAALWLGFLTRLMKTPPQASRVLISKIMAGKTDNAACQFIEFYNPNETVVDLTGWTLKKKLSRHRKFFSDSQPSERKNNPTEALFSFS